MNPRRELELIKVNAENLVELCRAGLLMTKPAMPAAPGKSQIDHFFNQWLTLMEEAFEKLTAPQFRILETRIMREIRFHRKPRSKKRGKQRPYTTQQGGRNDENRGT